MISWDVINGLARRSWARNPGAIATVKNAVNTDEKLNVTMPNLVDDEVLDAIFKSR